MIRLNETFNFNVLTGYVSPQIPENTGLDPPQVSQLALLTFIDYQQVPVDEEQQVLYSEVVQNTAYVRIPISLPGFEEPGSHDLLVIKIDNPRVPLCVLQGLPDGYLFSPQVYTNRAAIEVLPE